MNSSQISVWKPKHVNQVSHKTSYTYHMIWGPIWEIAVCHPAAHICGPSTAIAKGVRITRDNIDKHA